MSAQHTPGRLTADGTVLLFARNAGGFSISGCPDAETNARRLAACWNACEGLDTEGLENLTAIGETIASMHDRATSGQLRTMTQARLATAQRDKLLAQLIRCRDMVGHSDSIAYIAEIDKTIAEVTR